MDLSTKNCHLNDGRLESSLIDSFIIEYKSYHQYVSLNSVSNERNVINTQ